MRGFNYGNELVNLTQQSHCIEIKHYVPIQPRDYNDLHELKRLRFSNGCILCADLPLIHLMPELSTPSFPVYALCLGPFPPLY